MREDPQRTRSSASTSLKDGRSAGAAAQQRCTRLPQPGAGSGGHWSLAGQSGEPANGGAASRHPVLQQYHCCQARSSRRGLV
jgi:hypothetical protein